jgi:signal peptidase II
MSTFKPGQFYWRNLNWLWLSALIIGADALTKYYASHYLHYATPVELTGFFNLTLLHNHGAAFSFLANSGGWQRWGFAILAGLVALGLLVWLLRIPRRTAANPIPQPAFNIADSAITLGVVFMLLVELLPNRAPAAATPSDHP